MAASLILLLCLPAILNAQNLLQPSAPAIMRINSGGPAFMDSRGNGWNSDRNFNAGTRVFADTTGKVIRNAGNATAGTTDATLYSTERYGPIVYSIPVPQPGAYIVHLHWAEIFFSAAGARRFSVQLENTDISQFTNIDLARTPGPLNAAVGAAVVPVCDGSLTISFIPIVENPKISGIAVFPADSSSASTCPATSPLFRSTPPSTRAIVGRPWSYNIDVSPSTATLTLSSQPALGSVSLTNRVLTFTPAASQAGSSQVITIVATNSGQTTSQTVNIAVDRTVVRLNCGGPSVTDSAGNQWIGDFGANCDPAVCNTGRLFGNASSTVDRSNDPTVPIAVVQTSRWDAPESPEMTYTFAVANGFYEVELIFAEVWSGAQNAGVRIFSLTVEGVMVNGGFDISAMAGFQKMFILTVPSVNVQDGKLDVTFGHVRENPAINGIRINVGCPTGQLFCSNGCIPAPCGGCGGVICPSGQVCSGSTCVVPGACNAPFVSEGGRCVYPKTGGTCPRNEVDCVKGCASAATQANPFTICTGGQCVDGVCVPNTLTLSDVGFLKTAITDFFNSESQKEITAAANPSSGIRRGDFVGALARGMFHDAGPGVSARGCLFVRDVPSHSCNGRICEFTNIHNKGLEDAVTQWHAFYTSGKLSNGNTIISTITLQDFWYLAGAQGITLASNNRIQFDYRWGRPACQCLNLRPFSACPNPPDFPHVMPEPEMPYTELTSIMEQRMGFTRREWFCLTGAHALGRCEPKNSGYARAWTTDPSRFSNHYFTEMMDFIWVRERGTSTNPSNPDVPIVGVSQFQDGDSPLNGGTLMLDSDMAMFWETEDGRCDVTHGGDGCPRRLDQDEFFFVNEMQSESAFFNCFKPTFQKLCELGVGASLRNPV